MSRCFPFPPPGYVKIGARTGDGAIEMESIKLQKEKKRAEKEQRKEKKRLKKEEKEQLKKQIEASCGNTRKPSCTKSLPENKSRKDSCAFGGRTLSDDSTKSGLSEEHDLPLPSNFFDLSDGNDTPKKRKRDDPVVTPSTELNGSKLKVSFTFRKPIEALHPASAVQNHSASQTLLTRRDEQPCSTSQSQPPLPATTGRNLKSVLDAADVKPPHCHKRKSSSGYKHKALFEEWCPLPLLSEEESGDQEWLFGAEQRIAKVARKNGISDALTMCRGAANSSVPRADYIPEAEIYVLPFTVLF